jgi:hypothetical protein
MKSGLVFAFTVLAASAAAAAAPDSVVGSWRALPAPSANALINVIGIPQILTFTDDGRLWVAQPSSRPLVLHPPLTQPLPTRPPYEDYLLGRYTARDGKVVAKGPSGETYAYELMKDGRLCVYPAPGMMPLAVSGLARPQEAGRQCYERIQNAA